MPDQSSLLTRRTLLLSPWPLLLAPSAGLARPTEQQGGSAPSSPGAVGASFPTQDQELVKEMVTVAHGQVARVRELVARHQTLAKANYDWGFGDWESALGAASHVGNREIAEFLLANGARPTIFSAAMLGQLDVVKAFVTASPGVQRIKGPHSITLLRHAMAGGATGQAGTRLPHPARWSGRSAPGATTDRRGTGRARRLVSVRIVAVGSDGGLRFRATRCRSPVPATPRAT